VPFSQHFFLQFLSVLNRFGTFWYAGRPTICWNRTAEQARSMNRKPTMMEWKVDGARSCTG